MPLSQEPANPIFSEEAERTAERCRKLIRSELLKLDKHPWAGGYYSGDRLGANISLVLAPKNGYLFEWHGCLDLYDRNYGSVVSEKEMQRFTFTYSNLREGFQGIESRSM